MLNCFTKDSAAALPIIPLLTTNFSNWLESQPVTIQNWLHSSNFTAKAGEIALIPTSEGKIEKVIFGISDLQDIWSYGDLAMKLPEGQYYLSFLENAKQTEDFTLQQIAVAWGLGAYQFTRYKKAQRKPAQLVIAKKSNESAIKSLVESIYLVRDLINTPAEDMTPLLLTEVANELAKEFEATFEQISGEELLLNNFPAVFTVGRASVEEPHLIELRWGEKQHPKLTLIGKGVCFDSGGLNLKSQPYMALMKKDMGGAAHALGLARMIMEANLPIRLRVLIPAVENVISGCAFRPGDVLTMRNGKTVEITDTDAEGRLILADVLTEAVGENPQLIIDFATLTGAARVALGTDIPVLFTSNDQLAKDVLAFSEQEQELMWRLPLHKPYRNALNSDIADIKNASDTSYAGAITAALFLQEFVPEQINWLHIDLMAWNLNHRPSHPKGGEAMGLLPIFSYLRQRFSAQH